MTRGTMRGMLRRRLKEVTADQWTDTNLNELLEIALHQVQKEIMKVRGDAFMVEDSAPLVASQEFYQLPSGFWYELLVKFRTSTSSAYNTLKRGSYENFEDMDPDADVVYDIRGRFITFGPLPTVSVNPGFKIQYIPTLAFGSDAAVPDIHLALHMAVVLFAQLLAMGETDESTSETAALYKSFVDDIPTYYHRGGDPQQVSLDAGGGNY